MNVKNNLKEIFVTSLLIIVALLLLNPFHFWMPDMFVMIMLAVALVLLGTFASFVLKEKAFDERDSMHRTIAGRNAYLAGALVLMTGIIVQGYSHSVDPWLVITLITMIVVKMVSRLSSEKNL